MKGGEGGGGYPPVGKVGLHMKRSLQVRAGLPLVPSGERMLLICLSSEASALLISVLSMGLPLTGLSPYCGN